MRSLSLVQKNFKILPPVLFNMNTIISMVYCSLTTLWSMNCHSIKKIPKMKNYTKLRPNFCRLSLRKPDEKKFQQHQEIPDCGGWVDRTYAYVCRGIIR